MGSDVLLHVIFASERLVANGTMHTLLTSVFLAVASSMAGCCEGGRAAMARSIWTRILVLSSCAPDTGALGGFVL